MSAAEVGRRCRRVTPSADDEGAMLFIEYDVARDGEIELVALINAVEENGDDTDGSAWMAWRTAEFDDDALGCVGVPEDQLALMEATEGADQLRALVERIILTDRARKEEGPP
jgi:hypothetical protein